jgi:hypothetical protein
VSFGQYAVGLIFTVASLVIVAVGAVSLTRAMLPKLSGSAAALGGIVIGLSLLLVALELAGIVGELTALGIVLSSAIVSGLAVLVGRRLGGTPPVRDAGVLGTTNAAVPIMVVIAAVALVAAPWLGWTIFSYRHGMQTIDSLWYHMPFAARFMQTGSILHLHYVDQDPVVAFYPANSELFHAAGLVMFRTDWLSPLITLAWAGLALLAAWVFGRRYGRERLALVAVLLVVGSTDLIDSQPGGAYNDITCLALLLGAAAILVNSEWEAGSTLVAALAMGLAVGTKVTMIIPAVLLAVGMTAVSPRGRRWRALGLWAGGLIVTGGYWYVRNLAENGNPLGTVHLHIGPVSLSAARSSPMQTIGQFITNGHVWSTYYLPGLRSAFGPVWWLVLALAAAGAVASLLSRSENQLRVLGAVALLTLVSLVVTPQTGEPGSFVYNLRYETPALALGLVLLAAHPLIDSKRRQAGLMVVLLAALVATELDGGIWPTKLGAHPLAAALSGTPAVAGAVLGLAVAVVGALVVYLPDRIERFRRFARGPAAMAACGLLAVGVLGGGWAVVHTYQNRRYSDTAPLPRTYAWAQSISGARIGIVGIFDQYPFYGRTDANYVQYVGSSQPHAGFGPVQSCRQWRELINRGRYRYVVVAPPGFPLTFATAPQISWMSAPGVSGVLSERAKGGPPTDTVTVFRVTSTLDPGTCPE